MWNLWIEKRMVNRCQKIIHLDSFHSEKMGIVSALACALRRWRYRFCRYASRSFLIALKRRQISSETPSALSDITLTHSIEVQRDLSRFFFWKVPFWWHIASFLVKKTANVRGLLEYTVLKQNASGNARTCKIKLSTVGRSLILDIFHFDPIPQKSWFGLKK